MSSAERLHVFEDIRTALPQFNDMVSFVLRIVDAALRADAVIAFLDLAAQEAVAGHNSSNSTIW